MLHHTFRHLALACALALALPTGAQTFRAALLAGGNLSQLDGDRLNGYHRVGGTAGMRVGAVLSERWQACVEMHYTQQGAHWARNDPPSATYQSLRLHYAEVPVLVQLAEWKFLFYGGLSYARLINYRVVARDGTDITDQQTYRPDAFSTIIGVTLRPARRYGFDFRWAKTLNGLQADRADGRYIGRTLSLRALWYLN